MAQLPIRVMSFNIRFDTEKDAPDHTWERRRESAIEVIRTYKPDVVGLQEVLAHQLADLMAGVGDYRAVGRAREAGGLGEMVPILFDPQRWELLASGDFWLSATPDIEGSLGWDADNPRITTWAHLRDSRSGSEFLIYNTHLDRWGEQARRESASAIVKKRADRSDLPCLITGDLNCGINDDPYRIFEAATFRDSYLDVSSGEPPGTVHHYKVPKGKKIDFVLCDASWDVLDARIIRDRPGGRFPSDHFPVMADLVTTAVLAHEG